MPHDELAELADAKMAVVGIFSLQVVLAPEGDSWIAQAIELDYAAAGDSQEDVRRRFEDGLCATIQEHFKIFGDLDNFLQRRPPTEDWLELLKQKAEAQWYSQVSVHRFVPPKQFFPFGEIKYYIPRAEQTAVEA